MYLQSGLSSLVKLFCPLLMEECFVQSGRRVLPPKKLCRRICPLLGKCNHRIQSLYNSCSLSRMKPLPQLFSHCLGWINCRVSSQTHFFHFSAKSAFTNNIFATKSPGSLLLTFALSDSLWLTLPLSLSFRSAFSLYLPNEFFSSCLHLWYQ